MTLSGARPLLVPLSGPPPTPRPTPCQDSDKENLARQLLAPSLPVTQNGLADALFAPQLSPPPTASEPTGEPEQELAVVVPSRVDGAARSIRGRVVRSTPSIYARRATHVVSTAVAPVDAPADARASVATAHVTAMEAPTPARHAAHAIAYDARPGTATGSSVPATATRLPIPSTRLVSSHSARAEHAKLVKAYAAWGCSGGVFQGRAAHVDPALPFRFGTWTFGGARIQPLEADAADATTLGAARKRLRMLDLLAHPPAPSPAPSTDSSVDEPTDEHRDHPARVSAPHRRGRGNGSCSGGLNGTDARGSASSAPDDTPNLARKRHQAGRCLAGSRGGKWRKMRSQPGSTMEAAEEPEAVEAAEEADEAEWADEEMVKGHGGEGAEHGALLRFSAKLFDDMDVSSQSEPLFDSLVLDSALGAMPPTDNDAAVDGQSALPLPMSQLSYVPQSQMEDDSQLSLASQLSQLSDILGDFDAHRSHTGGREVAPGDAAARGDCVESPADAIVAAAPGDGTPARPPSNASDHVLLFSPYVPPLAATHEVDPTVAKPTDEPSRESPQLRAETPPAGTLAPTTSFPSGCDDDIKNFIPINVATADDVNDLDLYRFVSLAQVQAGTGSRPPWGELKARIEAQPTFTTAPQQWREKREAERASGQGSSKSSRTR